MKTGNSNAEEFAAFENLDLPLALSDDGTGDWHEHWVLDGERAEVRNTPKGMVFAGGPVTGDQACHAVLWTRKSFCGPMKVEFDFTRLDFIFWGVNILYFHAQGVGGEFDKDIHKWADRREIPFMDTYFRNMKLLHLSFAAFNNEDGNNDDYLRVRRYPVAPGRSMDDIEVPPTIDATGFFQAGMLHNMCAVKTADKLALRIRSEAGSLHHVWDTTKVAPPQSGPLGIRHMWTKCSRYANLKIHSD